MEKWKNDYTRTAKANAKKIKSFRSLYIYFLLHLCTQRYYYLASHCALCVCACARNCFGTPEQHVSCGWNKNNDFNRINSDNWFVWFDRAAFNSTHFISVLRCLSRVRTCTGQEWMKRLNCQQKCSLRFSIEKRAHRPFGLRWRVTSNQTKLSCGN